MLKDNSFDINIFFLGVHKIQFEVNVLPEFSALYLNENNIMLCIFFTL